MNFNLSKQNPKNLNSRNNLIKKEKKLIKKRGKLGYSLISSDSIPYKCLAVNERMLGIIAITPKIIARRSQDIDSKTRVSSKASLMTPNAAHIRETKIMMVPIQAH